MTPTSCIIQAMNNITLDDGEEWGLDIEVIGGEESTESFKDFNIQLCPIWRFITEGVVKFQVMQQTMAALRRPRKGVYIKEIDTNLYLYQFYHELDIKRVLEGSPWSFNRKALIVARMKIDEIPRWVDLNTLDLWVQVHELRSGFMTEKVLKEVGIILVLMWIHAQTTSLVFGGNICEFELKLILLNPLRGVWRWQDLEMNGFG